MDLNIVKTALEAASSSALLEKYPEPYETLLILTKALYSIDSSDTHTLRSILGSIDAKSHKISDLFVRAYLSYHLALQTLDLTEFHEAVNLLQTLESNEHLESCNRSLLGMVQYFLADSKLSIASDIERNARKITNPHEILVVLNEARLSIESSRANFDELYWPGLWVNSYRKSVEIYSALAEYSYPDQSEKYEVLKDRAIEITSFF